ncbi:hypothetical protein J5834_02275 [bacterium]|nr:hypothetical protein [bacterium]
MLKLLKKLFVLLAVLMLFSCNTDTKLVYPSEDVINRVTDFYLLSDNETFLILSSDMNRRYDFGRLVMMKIAENEEGGKSIKFVDSVLVPAIAGKMAVNESETTVYVTTRDDHGLVRVSIKGEPGEYRLAYDDDTDGNIPKILETKKEPYAVIWREEDSILLVTHLLNGELSIVDGKKWEVIQDTKLKYGVTDILFDDASGYYMTSHRSSGNITLIDLHRGLENEYVVSTKEISLGLPTKGFDIRSLKKSRDENVFYAAFQNIPDEDNDYEEDTAPQLVTFSLENKKTNIINTFPLNGDLGEISVFPYTTGSEEEDTLFEGELIFIANPSENRVRVYDPARNQVLREISYGKDDECEPYQLYSKALGETSGYLFVSCFSHDLVYVYEVDLSNESLLTEIGALK